MTTYIDIHKKDFMIFSEHLVNFWTEEEVNSVGNSVLFTFLEIY